MHSWHFEIPVGGVLAPRKLTQVFFTGITINTPGDSVTCQGHTGLGGRAGRQAHALTQNLNLSLCTTGEPLTWMQLASPLHAFLDAFGELSSQPRLFYSILKHGLVETASHIKCIIALK